MTRTVQEQKGKENKRNQKEIKQASGSKKERERKQPEMRMNQEKAKGKCGRTVEVVSRSTVISAIDSLLLPALISVKLGANTPNEPAVGK